LLRAGGGSATSGPGLVLREASTLWLLVKFVDGDVGLPVLCP